MENSVEVDVEERKRSVSEVAELTDMEQNAVPQDQAQNSISENNSNENGPVSNR